jgi:hypothetical protein
MAITRTTWTDGSTVINNARLQAIYDAIELTWALDTYTPTWTASSVNPSIGNGTITGKYLALGGKCVLFAVTITAGSTTTYGTGSYSVSLPLSADTGYQGVINVFALDGASVYNGVGYIDSSTTTTLSTQHESLAGAYNSTTPFTFGSGDKIHVFGVYFRS